MIPSRFSSLLHLLLLAAPLVAGPAAPPPPSAGKVSVLRNVPYETPTGLRKMDIYLPARAEQSPGVPCVIWMGKSEPTARDESVCGDLAGAGFIVASIDFEPDNTASDQPAVIGKSAVRFLRTSADRFHLDERLIAIAGASNGGTAALLAGLTRDQPRFEVKGVYPGVSDRVSVVVSLSAATDWREMPQAKGFPAAAMEELRVLSPVTYVAADSPAVLIFHGTNDKVIANDHATNLKKLLAKHRVPNRLVLLDRVGHGYSLTATNGRPLPTDVKGICVTFLRTYLVAPK